MERKIEYRMEATLILIVCTEGSCDKKVRVYNGRIIKFNGCTKGAYG